jgi:hypothetical protein
LNWTDQGVAGTDISSGFRQDGGVMTSVIKYDELIVGSTFLVSDTASYTAPNEFLSSTSSVKMQAGSAGESSIVDISFAPTVTTTAASNAVKNAMFRIHLIDNNQSIAITAQNGGTDVPVTITPGANISVAAQTATSTSSTASIADAAGSALVELTAPANIIRLTHTTIGTGVVHITDVYFEPNPLY